MFHTGLDYIVELLIDNGANVNGLQPYTNVSALALAIVSGEHMKKEL